jgi:hypothetical protein
MDSYPRLSALCPILTASETGITGLNPTASLILQTKKPQVNGGF